MRRTLFSFLVVSALVLRLHAADAPNPAEAKLREAVRNTMLQLRDVQTQLATVQAEKEALDLSNKDLTAKLEEATAKAAAEQEAAAKISVDLQGKIAERERSLAELKLALETSKVQHQRAEERAQATEAKRAAAAARVIVLERIDADQNRQNLAMFQLGNEILTRYEKFGLGDALLAREPFVGITRVKFENLIQDYGDQLADLRLKPAAPSTPAPKPATATDKKKEKSSVR